MKDSFSQAGGANISIVFVLSCGNSSEGINKAVGTIEAIFDGLEKVDLLKWIVSVAIPSVTIWSWKWFSDWREERAAKKKREHDLNVFLIGLPDGVQSLLAEFRFHKKHTITLPSNDSTVQLAVAFGVISMVSSATPHLGFYMMRRDIWENYHNNIVKTEAQESLKKPDDQTEIHE